MGCSFFFPQCFRGVRRHYRLMSANWRTATPQARSLCSNRVAVLSLITVAGGSDLRVFGSVARGDASEGSDIDLVAHFPDAVFDLDLLLVLSEQIGEVVGYDVDLACLKFMRTSVARSVQREWKAL